MDSILSVQNKNFQRDGKCVSSLEKSRKSWNLANPVTIYRGIIELRHLIDLRRMVLLKERHAEIKEGTFAVLLQSGLHEKMVG